MENVLKLGVLQDKIRIMLQDHILHYDDDDDDGHLLGEEHEEVVVVAALEDRLRCVSVELNHLEHEVVMVMVMVMVMY